MYSYRVNNESEQLCLSLTSEYISHVAFLFSGGQSARCACAKSDMQHVARIVYFLCKLLIYKILNVTSFYFY